MSENNINIEETIKILGGKESSSGSDDSFFWEELLADDDKDWSKEYLGIEVKENAKS